MFITIYEIAIVLLYLYITCSLNLNSISNLHLPSISIDLMNLQLYYVNKYYQVIIIRRIRKLKIVDNIKVHILFYF